MSRLFRSPRFWMALAVLGVGLAALGWLLAWLIRIDAVVLLAQLNTWLADEVLRRLGYVGVFALMAIESSVIPLPSEIVMPPAGDLARRLAEWNLGGVIAAGTLGSIAGAAANYWLAQVVGRPLLIGLIRRYGRLLHVSVPAYERAERQFNRHGAISIFVSRLLPGVRHLISIPAGLARMRLGTFLLLTLLGAGLWNSVLAYLGYWFGQQPEQLAQVMKTYSHAIVAGCLLLVGLYVGLIWLRRVRGATEG